MVSAAKSKRVSETIKAMAKIHGREFSPEASALYILDLSPYSEEQILAALDRCRRELQRFPMLADLIERIPGEHPGAEEAWALLPSGETASVFWTDEIAMAYGDVRELLSRDEVAARMAFKEIYLKLVSESRGAGRRPNWHPTFGTDESSRISAIRQAAARGRINQADAERLLPPLEIPRLRQIGGPVELEAPDAKKYLDEIKKMLDTNANEEKKEEEK